MDHLYPARLRELRDVADRVAREVLAPGAEAIDRAALWPAGALRALGDAGLMGLLVPRPAGGEGQGLLGLVAVTEALARACSSTAMCFGMHCVGTAAIAAKATAFQRDRYLTAIAEGRHVTTLALSEPATGSHLYFSETRVRSDGDAYVVDGVKTFVTNGGFADSYVISTVASEPDAKFGEFSCLIVDAASEGLAWQEPWRGFGMRGNSSRGFRMDAVRVPRRNLLGEEGDQVWYVFEVVTPYFLMAMSAVYLGIARSALDLTVAHLKSRRTPQSDGTLADVPELQLELAEMWAAVTACRHLVHDAARRGDEGDQAALPSLYMSKAAAAEMVVAVTNQAMTLCGGIAYRENAHLARLLRDARASHVMAPTTHMLKQWTARTLLGRPLL
jgi:alkylation response protein AidB-like acyl-CoA dehydrogenase